MLTLDETGGSSSHAGTPRGMSLPGLAAVRQSLGFSLAELEARSGMSEKTISWLERGDALITRRSSGSALETLANFAQRGLLEQDPPRWLLEFTSGDLEYYLHGHTDPLST